MKRSWRSAITRYHWRTKIAVPFAIDQSPNQICFWAFFTYFYWVPWSGETAMLTPIIWFLVTLYFLKSGIMFISCLVFKSEIVSFMYVCCDNWKLNFRWYTLLEILEIRYRFQWDICILFPRLFSSVIPFKQYIDVNRAVLIKYDQTVFKTELLPHHLKLLVYVCQPVVLK